MSRKRNEINPFDEWFPASAVTASTAEPESEAEPVDFFDPETLGLVWNGAWFALLGANVPPDHAAFLAEARAEFEAAGSPAERWDDALGFLEFGNAGTFDQPPPGSAVPTPVPQASSDSPSAPGEAAPATGPPGAGQAARLELALSMAARGFRVFPLLPGSKEPPRGVAGVTRATTDAATIRAWFVADPAINYGVAAGAGLLIVDVDGEEGEASLAKLEAEHGALPATLTVGSPSHGRHLYMRGDDVSNSAGKIGPGIDIRSASGYVVGPGCYFANAERRPDKRAGWYAIANDVAPAAAPPWLVLMAGEAKHREREQAPAAKQDAPEDIARARYYLENDAAPAIEGQGGDAQTYKVACELRDMGMSEATALDLMAEHWNARCTPLWDGAGLAAKVANAFAYGQNSPAVKSAEAMKDEAGAPVALPASEAAKAPPTSSVMFAGDAAAKPLVPWLIDNTLPLVGVGLLAGQSRVGKTFVALNLARAIATGGAFFSRPVRRPGGVLIAAAEAPETLGGRIRALCSHFHPDGVVDPHSLPIAIAAIHSKDQLLQAAKDAAAAIRAKFGVPLRLIIVDTVMAAYQLDKEDDAGQVTKAMKHLEGVGRAVGALALGVHHYGKTAERGARGSSAWIASSDTILAATGATDEETGVVKDRRLALVKARDGETGDLAFFDIVGVEVGIDEDGRTRRAGLMQLLGRTKPAGGKPPTHFGTLIDAFEQAANGDHGIARGGKRFAPEIYAREIFDDRVKPLFKAPGSSRKAWSDAFKFALDTGQIVKADGLPNCYAAKPHSGPGDFTGALGIATLDNAPGVEDPNRLT